MISVESQAKPGAAGQLTLKNAQRAFADELGRASAEIAWGAALALEVADKGSAYHVTIARDGQAPKENDCCSLINSLKRCVSLFERLCNAFEQGQQQHAEPLSLQAWSRLVEGRPEFHQLLTHTLAKEFALCSDAVSAIRAEPPSETAHGVRQYIQASEIPERVRRVLCALPDAVILPSVGMTSSNGEGAISLAQGADLPKHNRILVNEEFTEAMKELDSMIGLDAVKEKVHSYADLIVFNRVRALQGEPPLPFTMNFIFTGNPGTGKTSVARCLGKILKAAGLLESGHLVESSRRDLVVGWVGQSEDKTAKVLESALGGVMFIDEAHQLTNAGDRDFGKKALEVIQKFMEDNAGKLAVIAAGYPNEMASFLAADPGLPSRFTATLEFPDYSFQELTLILADMLAKLHLEPSSHTLAGAHAFLTLSKHRSGAFFGNARDVRNLVQAMYTNHARQIVDELKREGNIAPKSSHIQVETIPFPELLKRNVALTELQALEWRSCQEGGGVQNLTFEQAGDLYLKAFRGPRSSREIAELPELILPDSWKLAV